MDKEKIKNIIENEIRHLKIKDIKELYDVCKYDNIFKEYVIENQYNLSILINKINNENKE